MSHQYKAVAAILKNTISSINEILKDPADEMHRIRITGMLQQQHDQLLLLTGSGDLETGASAVLGPAKTIGGKPIAKVRKFTADDMIPADDKVNNLRKQVDAAVDYFGAESNAEGILGNIPELIIRGVAKKAGLPFKKDEVDTITVEFIEKIKEALAAAGIKGGHVDEDDDNDDDNDDDEMIAGAMDKLVPVIGEGGISEVHVVPIEDVAGPIGSEVTINEVETPKAEEPKQETKSDPKKKNGK